MIPDYGSKTAHGTLKAWLLLYEVWKPDIHFRHSTIYTCEIGNTQNSLQPILKRHYCPESEYNMRNYLHHSPRQQYEYNAPTSTYVSTPSWQTTSQSQPTAAERGNDSVCTCQEPQNNESLPKLKAARKGKLPKREPGVGDIFAEYHRNLRGLAAGSCHGKTRSATTQTSRRRTLRRDVEVACAGDHVPLGMSSRQKKICRGEALFGCQKVSSIRLEVGRENVR